MGAQHTPEPWIVAAKPSSVVGWPIVAQSGRVIASLNYVQHSKIDPKVEGDDAFNRESRANGALIAAAPDLLRVACNLLALAEIKWGNLDEGVNELFADARAAIAKATLSVTREGVAL